MKIFARLGILIPLILLGSACGDDSQEGGACVPGELGCECNMGSCLQGLDCVGNICAQPGPGDGDSGETIGGDGDPTGDGDPSGDGDGDPTGDGDGDPTTGDGDGDDCEPGLMLCGDECVDLNTSDDHCGECDFACDIALGLIGGCDNGTCEPSLTECLSGDPDPIPCEDICSSMGKTCAPDSCNGATLWTAASQNFCIDNGTPVAGPCSFPNEPIAWYRCCCQQ